MFIKSGNDKVQMNRDEGSCEVNSKNEISMSIIYLTGVSVD